MSEKPVELDWDRQPNWDEPDSIMASRGDYTYEISRDTYNWVAEVWGVSERTRTLCQGTLQHCLTMCDRHASLDNASG